MIKINTILALILLNVFRTSAQDTICFKNQGLLSARILEVDKEQISYTHTSDTSGFIYHADKSRISWIKYRTGLVDSIKAIQQTIVNVSAPGPEDIEIKGKTLAYHGKNINDRKLKFLIDNCTTPEAKSAMLEEYRMMKAYERRQKIYTPIGLACGFAVVPASLIYAVAMPQVETETTLTVIAGGIIGGAIIRITSVAINTISRNKRFQKRKNIALMYNEIN